VKNEREEKSFLKVTKKICGKEKSCITHRKIFLTILALFLYNKALVLDGIRN